MSALPSPEPTRPTASSPTSSDLRHMTSNVLLASPTKEHRSSNRGTHLLRTSDARLGSRSPNSIPSSPASVHSSSSAIFERDIEPISPPSPPMHTHHHQQNPHRIPRAKGTEQLEHSVPSVLDSAASILTSLEDTEAGDQVAIVSPATAINFDNFDVIGRSSGFASPIGSFRSRSPSPLGIRSASGGLNARNELLLSIPHSHTQALATGTGVSPGPGSSLVSPGPGSPLVSSGPGSPQTLSPATSESLRPTIQTGLAPPASGDGDGGSTPSIITPTSAIVTPTSAYYSAASQADEDATITTTTREQPLPAALPSVVSSPASPISLTTTSPISHATTSPISLTTASLSHTAASPISHTTASLSHPPSPTHVANKRLSFMSYSDLLSSTPATTHSLSSFTTSASSADPPPHIPSVSGLTLINAQQGGSAATSLRGFAMGSFGGGGGIAHSPGGITHASGGITHVGKRDSIAMLDDVGGEWEREGLGRGLEERLEALMPTPTVGLSKA